MATILIVDDHVLNRQFLSLLLGYSGHRLVEANDGVQGLQMVQERRPDLVIADILMPNMDGYQFVSRLRTTPEIADTPVIFYTAAYHEREAGAMAEACGVRWVLPKPSDPDLILKTVHEALGTPISPGTARRAQKAGATASTRLSGLDNQLSEYLGELETSSDLMSRLLSSEAKGDRTLEGLQQLVTRLARALESLQAVSLRLTALIELGIDLATERDPLRVLEIGCRVVQDICVARYAAIGMLDADDGAQLRQFVTRGFDEAVRDAMPWPQARSGVLGTVLAQRRPLRLSLRAREPAEVGLPETHPSFTSLLAVPVASQNKVFGWLYLAEKIGAEAFSEIDERAASTVAAQLAVVYENLNLYSEIQRQHDQLIMEVSDRKHAQQVLRRALRARTVMAECNHVMVHATDETRLLQEMCRTLVEAGGYRGARIDYLDAGGRARTVAQAGISSPAPEPAARPVGDWSRSWVVMDLDPEEDDGGAAPTGTRSGSNATVTLPLKDGSGAFGILTIQESETKSFDAEHIATLKGLADDIAYGVTSLRTKAAREKAEHDLHRTEEKLSSILDSVDNVVWSATEREFIYLNSMVERIYGHPIDHFYQDRQLWFTTIHAEDRARVQAAHARLHDEGGSFVQEYRVVRPDGEQRWIEERARAIRDGQRTARIDGVAIDISERKAYEARIEYLADHDALTGLANRNLLGDRTRQAMAQARRHGHRLALLFLDLDRFKGINDSFGHQLGDGLLLQVAARLRNVVREGDTVARQGGDEFIILLTGIQRIEDVTAAAYKIFEAFSRPIVVEGRELFVSASIGVTLFPEDGEDLPTLLRNADTAMYRAKEEHGNAFQFYSREMSERALERAELESALRRALERDEFELYYQPKVDIRSRRIIGAEALIRWNHPRLGMVPPTRFIPLAEEIGLIIPIGDWVLQTACAQNKAWQRSGLPAISVSVNLSARQFASEGLVGAIARTLRQMELDPCHLELELTESVVMNSAELYVNKLRELQDLGVQLSIDDFGTGYSSLSYLKRFPLHHLKIDQSFVRDLAKDDDDAAITSTVISLGHSLNLKVIAEGVETEEQMLFLRDHQCDEMQGYYFSRPLPAAEFAALLERD